MTTEINASMSERAYHADPCEVPSLSASIAHRLVNECPAKAVVRHPRCEALTGGRYHYHPEPETADMSVGTMVHAYLLDPKALGDRFVELPYDTFRTKAAREERDRAVAAGKTPLKTGELTALANKCRDIMDAISTAGIVLAGPMSERELSVFWTEQSGDHGEVQCRGRLDLWDEPGATITDLKTTASAHPDAVSKSIMRFGYDVQATAYIRAIEANYPELEDRVKYRWVFVETAYPYCVTGVVMDGMMAALGKAKWERAVNLWARCVAEKRWPYYSAEVVYATPPKWAMEAEFFDGGDEE